MERHVKVVVVGDGKGKTALLHVYKDKKYPEEYIPTVFDNYSCKVMADGKEVTLTLWDTAGQEDFERLRPLAYNDADVFICTFNLSNHNSFINVKEKWIPEVRQYSPNSKIILCGTHRDLVMNESYVREMAMRGEIPVKKEEAMRLMISTNCHSYVEVSAKQNYNVKKVFDDSIRATPTQKNRRINILPILGKGVRNICKFFLRPFVKK